MKCVFLFCVFLFISCIIAEDCSAGNDCTGKCNSTIILNCGPGYYCNGVDPVSLCPAGYYCDNSGEKHDCPKGKVCPPGSSSYLECGSMSVCGKNSGKGFNVGALFILIFVNGGMLVLLLIRTKCAKSSRQNNGYILHTDHVEDEEEQEEVHVVEERAKEEGKISFVFKDLQASVGGKCFSKRKDILQGVSGHFTSGRVTAIMGPSGAGKTSILNALLGKVNLNSGSISVNGLSNKETIEKMKDITGFVPQDDIMMEELTVEEVLMHNALLYLSPSIPLSQKEQFVDTTISVLGLSSVRKSVIGGIHFRGISGGEKKRVNIGLELVKKSSVLFLDEPTSGLDSASALTVFQYISKITKQFNLMTVAVLHQPRYDIFQLCDDLLLLGKGGRSVYSGPREGVLPYLESKEYVCPPTTNPADFLLDVISNSDNLDNLASQWNSDGSQYSNSENDYRNEELDLNRFKKDKVNFFSQIFLFTKRAAKQVIATIKTIVIDLLIHTFGGIVIGVGFVASDSLYVPPIPFDYVPFCPEAVRSAFCEPAVEDKLARLGIYIVMGLGVAAGTVAVRTFWFERLVYFREASGGANKLAYFIAKNIIDLPLIIINGLVFTSAFMLVASPLGNFGKYLITFMLYQFCIYAVGYICTWMSDLPALLAVVVALLLGLGTGGVSSVKNMGFGADISWSRWAGEAVFLIETERLQDPLSRNLTNNYMDARYGYAPDNLGHDMWAMIVTGLALRAFAFILQINNNKDKQK